MSKKTYRVGERYASDTTLWLTPHIKRFKGDRFGLQEATLENGQIAHRGDMIVEENGSARVLTFEEVCEYLSPAKCATCTYAVPCADPHLDIPVCLAGGHPNEWNGTCRVLRNGPENQLDRFWKPKDGELSHIEDMAEWDADYYAKQVLGKTDDELDATGDEGCIHAWVTKDLLRKQRCALIPYERNLIDLAARAIDRFEQVGSTLHASNIDAEIASFRSELASIIGASSDRESGVEMYPHDEPTDKQLSFIADISEALQIPFTGNTKQAASDYIDEHISEYKRIQNEMEDEAFIQYLIHEDAGDRPD